MIDLCLLCVVHKLLLKRTSPEWLVQIQNNFTETFIITSIIIAQMVSAMPNKMATRAVEKKYL